MERSYQNGKIYCIRNTVNKDIYIGSTTQALSRRMVKHRSKAKSEEANHYKLYKLMNSIGVDTFYIEHLVDCPCQSLEHLRAEEGKWIRDMGTLNGRIAGRDHSTEIRRRKGDNTKQSKTILQRKQRSNRRAKQTMESRAPRRTKRIPQELPRRTQRTNIRNQKEML